MLRLLFFLTLSQGAWSQQSPYYGTSRAIVLLESIEAIPVSQGVLQLPYANETKSKLRVSLIEASLALNGVEASQATDMLQIFSLMNDEALIPELIANVKPKLEEKVYGFSRATLIRELLTLGGMDPKLISASEKHLRAYSTRELHEWFMKAQKNKCSVVARVTPAR